MMALANSVLAVHPFSSRLRVYEPEASLLLLSKTSDYSKLTAIVIILRSPDHLMLTSDIKPVSTP
jgi:hypothetical protein